MKFSGRWVTAKNLRIPFSPHEASILPRKKNVRIGHNGFRKLHGRKRNFAAGFQPLDDRTNRRPVVGCQESHIRPGILLTCVDPVTPGFMIGIISRRRVVKSQKPAQGMFVRR